MKQIDPRLRAEPMRRNGMEIRWDVLGAELARTSDREQALFLGAFCEELLVACKSTHGAQVQLAFVTEKLTRDERDLLAMLAEGGCQ